MLTLRQGDNRQFHCKPEYYDKILAAAMKNLEGK